MGYDLASLFNDEWEQQAAQINQVLSQPDYYLSTQQIQELVRNKAEVLYDNHLLDLSFNSQHKLAQDLENSEWTTPKNYFQKVVDMQEVFYFLRSQLPGSYSDEDLLEQLLTTFEVYEGSIQVIQAKTEEWIMTKKLEGALLYDETDFLQ